MSDSQQRRQRDDSLQALRSKVEHDRSTLRNELDNAKQRLQRQKEQEAETERKKHKQI